VKTNEGVVLGVEKKLPSKLMEPSKSEKLVEVSINSILMVLTIFYELPEYLTYLLFVD
jgi:20S proteasome alpha/beta subunit